MSRQSCLPRTTAPQLVALADLDADRIAAAPKPLASRFHADFEDMVQNAESVVVDFGQVRRDCQTADLEEAEQREQTLRSAANLIRKVGASEKITALQVLSILDVLADECDGDSSMQLQECVEAIEGDLPQKEKVLRKIDVAEAEAFPVDFSGERRA